jgi:EAL domain-containing protein (putative c-di-GMP-specific phosphodiesterase class I)
VESIVEGTECRLTERLNQQYRFYSVEQAMQLDGSTQLFLALQVSEISAEYMPDSLEQLANLAERRHQLVAQLPESGVCDIPYFRQFIQALRDRDIRIAYANFCGSPGQIAGWDAVAPDYLKLAPSLVRGISHGSDSWRTLQSVIQATEKLGCATIATGLDDNAEVQCLTELGCQYGQGEYFGAPQSITAFATPNAVLAAVE